ncbi:MAG: hypothetical protein BRC59_13470 [Cyanobacteria bacterium SW_4_48_29]|nr:MAG: hypothetical protein BRC59_13470 [Cyanobacteria bacterium SW_4_48_29]
MGDGKAREHQEQGSRGKRRRGDTGTRGRGELRDTQISARRSQGFEGTSNPVSLSSRHPLSASVPKGLSAPGAPGAPSPLRTETCNLQPVKPSPCRHRHGKLAR